MNNRFDDDDNERRGQSSSSSRNERESKESDRKLQRSTYDKDYRDDEEGKPFY